MKKMVLMIMLIITPPILLNAQNNIDTRAQNGSHGQSSEKYHYLFSEYIGRNVDIVALDGRILKGKLIEAERHCIRIISKKGVLSIDITIIKELKLRKSKRSTIKHLCIVGVLGGALVYLFGGLLSS